MALLVMLQTIIVSRLPILLGTADLVLIALVAWALQERVKNAWAWTIIGGLLVSYVSALPYLTPLIGYLIITWIALTLRKRIWQTPILAMLVVTFLGTLITQGLAIVALQVNGITFSLRDALELVVLPSVLLNLLLAMPIHTIMVDLAHWAFPLEIQS